MADKNNRLAIFNRFSLKKLSNRSRSSSTAVLLENNLAILSYLADEKKSLAQHTIFGYCVSPPLRPFGNLFGSSADRSNDVRIEISLEDSNGTDANSDCR